ncbi:MAG: hypothetical protein JNL40_02635 [Cyclobacteriaceae bacterium]|nr:hypothetical protein [Cyclobacteriaceae bacterium]
MKTRINVFILLIFFIAPLYAQVPANFAGQWEYDKAASKPGVIARDYPGKEFIQITQNSATFSYLLLYRMEGNPDFKTTTETYYLDGKERIEKKGTYSIKKTATWSPDKKVLTLITIQSEESKGIVEEYLTRDIYQLSADGRTLSIDKMMKSKKTGENVAMMVYHK